MRRAMRAAILLLAAGPALAGTLRAAPPEPPPLPLLSAQAERLRDLRRILYLPELDRLGPIDRIERLGPHSWRVTVGDCTLDVHMIQRRLREGMPGYGRIPRTWEPRAQTPVCRR
jgi:hypothetical protein